MWAAVLRRWRRHSGRFSPRLGTCTGGHEVKTTRSGPLFGLFCAGSSQRASPGTRGHFARKRHGRRALSGGRDTLGTPAQGLCAERAESRRAGPAGPSRRGTSCAQRLHSVGFAPGKKQSMLDWAWFSWSSGVSGSIRRILFFPSGTYFFPVHFAVHLRPAVRANARSALRRRALGSRARVRAGKRLAQQRKNVVKCTRTVA